jgi:hypothetical protein
MTYEPLAGDPLYPPPYPPPDPGYPPPGYPRPAPRPVAVTVAAVLGFVSAALLGTAALELFAGASLLSSLQGGAGGVTAEFVLAGLVDLLAAGLLVAAGVLLLGRHASGRALYGAGTALVLGAAIYWVSRWANEFDDPRPVLGYALLLGVLAVAGVLLAWTRAGAAWLAAPRQPANAGSLNW